MKILVTGSRRFTDPFAASLAIDKRLGNLPEGATVIHGGALGADKIAAEAAERHGHPVEAFFADWDAYGKRAGVIRNLKMLDEKPKLVIAFWNGESRGTLHVINNARQRHIPVEIVPLV